MSNVEERLKSLGIKLPEPPKAQGNYVGAVTYGNLVYLSGSGPMKDDGSFIVGKVPTDISEEEACQAARLTGLNLIATLKNHIGDLDRFQKMIKALGMVNCEPDFGAQPKVINGFSDLMVEVFGDAGRGARSAVGMGSLPAGIPVEIEMIVEIKQHALLERKIKIKSNYLSASIMKQVNPQTAILKMIRHFADFLEQGFKMAGNTEEALAGVQAQAANA